MAEGRRFSGKGEGSAGEGCGDSRTALLEAALHCFAQRGFDGTSIRDIAAAAGRNSSLISHHFGSKEGLYEEVFRQVLEVRRASLGRAAEGVAPRDRSEAVERMKVLISTLCLEFILPGPSQEPRRMLGRKLLLHELRDPRPGVAALLVGLVEPWICRFTECLAQLRPEATPAGARFLATSVMGQMMVHLLMQGLQVPTEEPGRLGPVEAAELLADYNLRALGVVPP
ncbi:MAG: HTH-type transcriptional regulator RutR [Acidobacteria bacterium ADurb.Bin340]|nr:MAG: HTH-type transcriptional regulator RutR [Acidobacteria bacterium ADurb.Bin340]